MTAAVLFTSKQLTTQRSDIENDTTADQKILLCHVEPSLAISRWQRALLDHRVRFTTVSTAFRSKQAKKVSRQTAGWCVIELDAQNMGRKASARTMGWDVVRCTRMRSYPP
jgi:hypothetical protein